MKQKLSVADQIAHMKAKGIKFTIVSEQEAYDYLENKNYYFRLKSYAKNYEVYQRTEKKGQYINLEFAYLQDLARIDDSLKEFIITTAIKLEHLLKVELLRDLNNSSCDGYSIVSDYFKTYPNALLNIQKKSQRSYTKDLVAKLRQEGFAVWNVIELFTLSELLKFYKFFYKKYPTARQNMDLYVPMQSVRLLRNAAAHNACILNALRRHYTYYRSKDKRVITFAKALSKTNSNSFAQIISNPIIYDFVAFIFVIEALVIDITDRQGIYAELIKLFDDVMVQNKEYYSNVNLFLKNYFFIKNIIDNIC